MATAQPPAIEWQKSLGGSNDEEGNATHQTSDGGYIVPGYTKSNNGDVTGNHGYDDFWVVKLTGTGGWNVKNVSVEQIMMWLILFIKPPKADILSRNHLPDRLRRISGSMQSIRYRPTKQQKPAHH